MKLLIITAAFSLAWAPHGAALARESPVSTESAGRDHGPGATGFGHDFQWAPRRYDEGQVGLHFGLSQPLLLGGFNVAVDAHLGQWVFEYSHGMSLDYNRVERVMLSSAEREAGLDLDSPWTTGFGIGYRVVDELYPMIEFKAHRYRARIGDETERYTTLSVGPALAHRLFVYDGLFMNTYLRYWPNLWTSRKSDEVAFDGNLTHEAVDLGFFANLSVGYAVDL